MGISGRSGRWDWARLLFGPVRHGFRPPSASRARRPCERLFRGPRNVARLQPLERAHGAGHALAVADAALAAHLDLQDRFSAGIVLDDGHVPELQARRFIRPQAGIGHEQDEVMKLL